MFEVTTVFLLSAGVKFGKLRTIRVAACAMAMEYQFTINRRLFSEFFARHKDTFVAFCELANNALQAQVKEIRITLARSPVDKLSDTLFESITIRDAGVGVSKSEFGWKILEIANDAKQGGKGIGRFAALQLGAAMRIETVAFDLVEKFFFQTSVNINSTGFSDEDAGSSEKLVLSVM